MFQKFLHVFLPIYAIQGTLEEGLRSVMYALTIAQVSHD